MLQYCLHFIFWPCAMWDLSFQTIMEPKPPALEARTTTGPQGSPFFIVPFHYHCALYPDGLIEHLVLNPFCDISKIKQFDKTVISKSNNY